MTTSDAPGPLQWLGEVRAGRELVRLRRHRARLAAVRRGDGRAVLLLPGLGAGERSMGALRRFLVGAGHDARPWGLGRNGGDVEALLAAMTARVEALAGTGGRPVALVGWSLGGIVAREVARDRPDAVARVVTFGTPLSGPRSSFAGRLYSATRRAEIEAGIAEREQRPIEVPVTAIHSRRDGAVAWRDCIDRVTPGVENVEVTSTHLGMGLDPDVWLVVADRLAPVS